jgi:hypothetical protein
MSRAQSGKLKFSGIVKDLTAAECPPNVWTDGRNVQFSAGRTVRVPGEAPFAATGRLFDSDVVWHVDNGVTRYWMYAGAEPGGSVGVGLTDGNTHWDITPAGWVAIGASLKVLTLGDLNGVFWINHPSLGAYWWDGDVTHIMTKLPGWPINWSVDVMRAHKNWLFGFALDDGTNYYGGRYVWSTSASPGSIPSSWTPTATNDAGDGDFEVPTGPILDAISVRDALFVMKANYTGVIQYIGGQYLFKPTDIFPSLGIFSTGACVEVGNLVYMLTGSGEVIRHDGTSYVNILYGKLQEYIGKQINYAHPESIFMYRDQAAGQVVLCYPVGTSTACTEAVTIEVVTGDAGIRDLPSVTGMAVGQVVTAPQIWDADTAAWDTDVTSWNQSAAGFQAGQIVYASGPQGLLQQGAASTQWVGGAAVAMPASVSRTGIDFDDMDGRKSIMGLMPVVVGNLGDMLSFQVGQQDIVMGPVTLDVTQSFAIGVDDHVDAQLDGRFGAIYVSSLGGVVWQLGTVAPLVARRGRW